MVTCSYCGNTNGYHLSWCPTLLIQQESKEKTMHTYIVTVVDNNTNPACIHTHLLSKEGILDNLSKKVYGDDVYINPTGCISPKATVLIIVKGQWVTPKATTIWDIN